jgi:hypothetical protein
MAQPSRRFQTVKNRGQKEMTEQIELVITIIIILAIIINFLE